MMKMVKNIKQVAVIGAGSMGHQISMLSALGGFETYLQDIEDKSLDQAKETLTKRMNKWVEQGKISELEKNEAFDKLYFTVDIKTAVENADLVIEIGAGSMGHQISMLYAIGGFETYLQDIEDKSLDQAKETLTKRMNKWVEQGKISELEKNEAFDKLYFTVDIKTAVENADLVIEAVVEKLDVKRKVFKE